MASAHSHLGEVEAEQMELCQQYRELVHAKFVEKANVMEEAIFWAKARPQDGPQTRQVALRQIREVDEQYQPQEAAIKAQIHPEFKHEISAQHPDIIEANKWRIQGKCSAVVLIGLIDQYRERQAKEGGEESEETLEIIWTEQDLERLRANLPTPVTWKFSASQAQEDPDSREIQLLDDKCPVCWGRYERLTALENCQHLFCFRCIVESLTESEICPKCRQPAYWCSIKFVEVERVLDPEEDDNDGDKSTERSDVDE